ncbi:MAG: SDR family NAD(P)-dependent oxidoreductase [Alphaproteobacteria bacterium]|jgi:3-oxoacyl-[acyl-carrier protein] reductase
MTTRTALVTGVVGGIGAAIASRLATDGAKVIVSDLPGEAVVAAADRLRLPMIVADLGDPLSVSNLKDHLVAQHGNPDIIVNAAGGVCNQIGTPLEEVEPSGWKSIFAANVDSALHLAQSFVPAMKANRWGRVITISSGAGLRPSLTGIHAYTAAKHALVGLTKQLSLELGQHGITVNSIAPGFILSNAATERQWQAYGQDGQAEIMNRIHTRRLGKPEDIAAAAAFLASEEASWITGQILSVDGGIA